MPSDATLAEDEPGARTFYGARVWVSTEVDPSAAGWAIRDAVSRLRRYGTAQVFSLDGEPRWILGAAPECSIPLEDPTGRVSRRHAELVRAGDEWTLTDLDSTNGVRADGTPRRSFALTPGLEVELGGVRLVAESPRLLALRELLGRWLGWAPECALDVDRALRAVREVAHLRAALILLGAGELAGVARRLHAETLGADRAFATCAAGEPGTAALERAVDGTLFLDGARLPSDLPLVIAGLRLPDARTRLVVGARDAEAAAVIAPLVPAAVTIAIPPLADRAAELDRVLLAYAADAAAVLGAPEPGLRAQDLRWIRDSGVASLDEAEDVMRRLVAMRVWGVTAGAERLGITHGALSRWARRRKLPT